MTYTVVVVTPPASEPVTLSEALKQLRMDIGDDDDHIEMLISVARDRIEKYCNRFFTTQTVKVIFDHGFSGLDFYLPFPNTASVDSLTYVDGDNVTTAVTGYTFDADRQLIRLPDYPSGAVSVTAEITTGAPAAFEGAKIAMLMMMADLYETRTENIVGTSVGFNPAVTASAAPYRVNLGV